MYESELCYAREYNRYLISVYRKLITQIVNYIGWSQGANGGIYWIDFEKSVIFQHVHVYRANEPLFSLDYTVHDILTLQYVPIHKKQTLYFTQNGYANTSKRKVI
jgi:hypothetical protein